MINALETFKQLGEQYAKEAIIEEFSLKEKNFVFTEKQKSFINEKEAKFVLYSGGYGCGKTLALIMKMCLYCLMFPKNRVLIGRKNISDIERALLPDLFEIVPNKWIHHKVKDGIIQFLNGSEIIMFGLDSLQQGSQADIKKAQQKLKSINIGSYFIDQLEEVEYEVFEVLNSRLRRANVPIRQGNMTCNPANFWAYEKFKVNPKKDKNFKLIEGSMLDNKENLPDDYLEEQLSKDENYVKRYVMGQWSTDIILKSVVVDQTYIKKFEALKRPPVREIEGFEIYQEPVFSTKYQIGVDPSEGAVDPSSISVMSEFGEKVCSFNGFLPIHALIGKVKFIYDYYHQPLIIPEANAAGAALIEGIRDLNVFEREVWEERTKEKMKKLGWKTSYQSKQALISYFLELCKKGQVKIYDEKTTEELKTFVWSDEAKRKGAGAERGFHDDNVISTMLACWGLNPKSKDQKSFNETKRKTGFQTFV